MGLYMGTHMFGFAAGGYPALDRALSYANQFGDARRGMSQLVELANFLPAFASTGLPIGP